MGNRNISGRMILLTGATGFLGHTIAGSFSPNELITMGRSPTSDIVCDFTASVPALPAVDVVIHAAGKAHMIPKTIAEEQEFYTVNVQGTINILQGLGKTGVLPRSFVFISSVAVYGTDSGMAIDENSGLMAVDAYGKSKIQAERIIQNWCSENGVICTILRLPLVAGPNPPGNLNAMIHGLKNGYYVNITGGKARKSMVLAQDVAGIISKASGIGGVYNLTDGYHPSFHELSLLIARQLGLKVPYNIPDWLARVFAKAGDKIGPKAPINSSKLRKITSTLTFDDSKARRELNWQPRQVLKEFKIQ